MLSPLAACDQDQTTGDEEGASVGDIQEEDAAGPSSSPEGAPGEDSAYFGLADSVTEVAKSYQVPRFEVPGGGVRTGVELVDL